VSVLGPPERFDSALAAAKTGAEWAIVALYREFQPFLLRYLRAQSLTDAEDLASETWLQAAARLDRFDGDEFAFRRWLFTIARRRVVDFRRRERRGRMLVGLAPVEPYAPVDPETQALAMSETEAALARIARLPADQAEIVLLRVLAGLDVENVAKIVGKRPGTVRVLQHRALKRLSDELVRERREAGVTE
jgi:RNA polymerase sigma-70 factor (ECF subfamily)